MARCKVCEYCGANLDFGERCDCRDQYVAGDRPGPCKGGEG